MYVTRTTVLLLFAFLNFSQGQVSGHYLQCTDSSHGYACPQCFCPNAKIIYTCELTNLEGTTRWVLPSNQCTTSGGSDQIQLSQAAGCGGIEATCGGFRATNMAVNRTTTCRVSELEVTTSDKLDGGVVKCSSINLRGDILEEYWSYPIVIIKPAQVTLAYSISSNDTVTIAWSLPSFTCNSSYNFTVKLSDNTTANIPSGTLNYTFLDLKSNTCYNVTLVVNSCSGEGLPASTVHCTTANPPADVVVTIVVKQDTLIPTQLQVVWQNNDSTSSPSYAVTINDAVIKDVSNKYLIWPINVVPSYFVVSISSVTPAGTGPPSECINISGTILSMDIVNTALVYDNVVNCRFSNNQSFYCVMCCSTDPSVPPDSSVYNISTSRGTEVTVDLDGLTSGQMYYCKVAATDDNEASCLSPVYGNIQTLINISPGHVSTALSPIATSAAAENVSISQIVLISFAIVVVIAVLMVIVLIIIRIRRAHTKTLCNAQLHMAQQPKNISTQERKNPVYEEVMPKPPLSGVQPGEYSFPLAPFNSIQGSHTETSTCLDQNLREYHTIAPIRNDPVTASHGQADSEQLAAAHVYAILENRAMIAESDSD